MQHSTTAFVGLRYLRAGHGSGFVSFVTVASVLGVALGVASLLVVLSVMNGFENELRDRLLSMNAHGTITASEADWYAVRSELESSDEVLAAAPFVELEGLLARDGELAGAVLSGIDPEAEAGVSALADNIVDASLDDLSPGSWNMILGRSLAARVGVRPGDTVTAMVPTVTPAGQVTSRMREFTVAGVFELGLQDHDSLRAVIHLDDAREFADLERAQGVRVKTRDIMAAPQTLRDWQNGATAIADLEVRDWTQENATYFRAVRIEKLMMGLLLSLIVGVAAFNIVASLVMVVTEKRAGIAILRTLGFTERDVSAVFILQGTVIGWSGAIMGLVLGILLSLNIDVVAPRLEAWFGFRFMPADLYYLTALPSELRLSDVLATAGGVLLLTVLATIYPARRAASVQPAEVLRYE